MTKEEFDARIKEDKWFDNPQELINYRLPVVQFYISHLNLIVIKNGKQHSTHGVNIVYREEDFTLVNQVYEHIKKLKG